MKAAAPEMKKMWKI